MKIHLERISSRYPYGKAVVWLFLLALVSSYLLFKLSGGAGFCLFHELTGKPCPTCGLSRALYSLSEIKIAQAISYNPFFLFVSLALMGHLLLPLLLKVQIKYQTSIKERRMLLLSFVVLTLLNWGYLLSRS